MTNATPADGINYAFSTYGSTYFELYVNDIDAPVYRDELSIWQARLTSATPQLQLLGTNGAGFTLRWDRAAGITVVESASNCSGLYAPTAWLTNRLELTNAAAGLGNGNLFFRIRQSQ